MALYKMFRNQLIATLCMALLGVSELARPASAQSDREQGQGSAKSMDVFDASPAPDNTAVRQLLDENPGSELIICIAGCRGNGVPTVMLKRPSKIEVSWLASQLVAAAGSDAATSAADSEVVCLAGCVGESGTIVFRGRQHAWIRQDERDTLAAAMAEIATRNAASGHHHPSLSRHWVSISARENLVAFTISKSEIGLVMAAAH